MWNYVRTKFYTWFYIIYNLTKKKWTKNLKWVYYYTREGGRERGRPGWFSFKKVSQILWPLPSASCAPSYWSRSISACTCNQNFHHNSRSNASEKIHVKILVYTWKADEADPNIKSSGKSLRVRAFDIVLLDRGSLLLHLTNLLVTGWNIRIANWLCKSSVYSSLFMVVAQQISRRVWSCFLVFRVAWVILYIGIKVEELLVDWNIFI